MGNHGYPPHIVSAVKSEVHKISSQLDMKIKTDGGGYIPFINYESLVNKLVHASLVSVAWAQPVGLNDIDGLAEGIVLLNRFGRAVEVSDLNRRDIKNYFSLPSRVIYWPPKYGDRLELSEVVLRKLEDLIKSGRFGGLNIQWQSSGDYDVSILAGGIAVTIFEQSEAHNVEVVKRLHPSAILLSKDGELRYRDDYIKVPRREDYPALVLHWG